MRTRRLLELTLVLAIASVTAACWIPLPLETAIVVEVYDAEGRPVDGIHVMVDTEPLITGEKQGNEGQVFKSLNDAGDHTVSVDPASLVDPQGGRRHILLASLLSSDTPQQPIYYGNRPFAGGSDVLTVPVAKGYISVVTVYLADLLQAPADNQWLTDGAWSSDFRAENGIAEFDNPPAPTFWWRMDPSLGNSVSSIFQLWQDRDGDVRYPLGVMDEADYPSIGYPDWQIPNAGLQKVESIGGGRMRLFAGRAQGAASYDVYLAPTSSWNLNPENNLVMRDVVSTVSSDLVSVDIGPGTANPVTAIRNGRSYSFAIRARDAASNLDTLLTAQTRSVRSDTVALTPNNLMAVNSISIADTDSGGKLMLSINCSGVGNSLRIYASYMPNWTQRPFDPRSIRGYAVCSGANTPFTLDWLVSRQAADKAPVPYTVGVEPFDAGNNVGTAATVSGAPVNFAAADTTQPYWANGGFIVASTAGMAAGQVKVDFDYIAVESSAFIRRFYYGPSSFAATNLEARAHTDLTSNAVTTLTFSDIPNGVPWVFAIQAIDAYGNASTQKSTSITLSDPAGGTGPVWTTDTNALFIPVGYPSVGTVTHPLGYTYSYNGFALTTSKSGEYTWRVIQESLASGQRVESKLGAFYTWNGFYFATTESGGLNMPSPSSNVRHRDVFGFVERQINADVMGIPFDSGDPAGYRQRLVQGFTDSLAAGSDTVNQLTIRYVTDEDGMTTYVGLDTDNNGFVDSYGAILEVVALDSAGNSTPTPPYLQRKVIQALYQRSPVDDLVNYPGAVLGVAFQGTLAAPDSTDPEW